MFKPVLRFAQTLISRSPSACSLATFTFIVPIGIAKGVSILAELLGMGLISKERRSMSKRGKAIIPVEGQAQDAVTVHVDDTCLICQEPIGTRNPEGIIEGLSELPCGHQFGSYCIKHYLKLVADDRPSCPVCRQMTYHSCGHPALPILLKNNNHDANAERKLKPRDEVDRQLKSTECIYCKARKTVLSKTSNNKGKKYTKKRHIPLAIMQEVFRLLKLRGRAARRRRIRAASQQLTTSEGEGANSNSDPAVWTGPYIDPFPRERDLEWEKWWDEQEPREKTTPKKKN